MLEYLKYVFSNGHEFSCHLMMTLIFGFLLFITIGSLDKKNPKFLNGIYVFVSAFILCGYCFLMAIFIEKHQEDKLMISEINSKIESGYEMKLCFDGTHITSIEEPFFLEVGDRWIYEIITNDEERIILLEEK